jgi:hypothetical protein
MMTRNLPLSLRHLDPMTIARILSSQNMSGDGADFNEWDNEM